MMGSEDLVQFSQMKGHFVRLQRWRKSSHFLSCSHTTNYAECIFLRNTQLVSNVLAPHSSSTYHLLSCWGDWTTLWEQTNFNEILSTFCKISPIKILNLDILSYCWKSIFKRDNRIKNLFSDLKRELSSSYYHTFFGMVALTCYMWREKCLRYIFLRSYRRTVQSNRKTEDNQTIFKLKKSPNILFESCVHTCMIFSWKCPTVKALCEMRSFAPQLHFALRQLHFLSSLFFFMHHRTSLIAAFDMPLPMSRFFCWPLLAKSGSLYCSCQLKRDNKTSLSSIIWGTSETYKVYKPNIQNTTSQKVIQKYSFIVSKKVEISYLRLFWTSVFPKRQRNISWPVFSLPLKIESICITKLVEKPLAHPFLEVLPERKIDCLRVSFHVCLIQNWSAQKSLAVCNFFARNMRRKKVRVFLNPVWSCGSKRGKWLAVAEGQHLPSSHMLSNFELPVVIPH